MLLHCFLPAMQPDDDQSSQKLCFYHSWCH